MIAIALAPLLISALAAAIRRAAAPGDAMSVAELHAPGAAGETTWLCVHTRRPHVVLEFVVTDPTLVMSFDPGQATVLAEALDRVGGP